MHQILKRTMSAASIVSLPKYAVGTQPYTIFIEGNIGSGKTTFLNRFQGLSKDICLLSEPVEEWRNAAGGNLLELMYKDPARWTMTFQSYVTLTMLRNHTMLTNKRIKIMERSYYSARYCFVENMYRNKMMDEVTYNVLQQWYKYLDESVHIQADLIVYLRTSPEVVHKRMMKRARPEEKCVPLEYLQQLHKLHEDWLIKNRANGHSKVLVLDADLELEPFGRKYESVINNRIVNPSLEEATPAVTVSPSKRQHLSS